MRWGFIFLLTIGSLFHPSLKGNPCCHLSQICEELAQTCQELAGLYEEEGNCAYLPVDTCCYWGQLQFYAEYLWWRVHQDGLNYAITGVETDIASTGEVFAIEGDWDSGFRIGVGILFPCNMWRLTLDWLRFRTDEEDSVIQPGPILRATRGLPMGTGPLDGAVADFNIKLDSYRLLLQVPFFTRMHVALQPVVGLRGDRISEDFNVTYDATVAADSGFFANNIRWWGIGPEIGLDGFWYLLPCFSVFGRGTLAGLYGNFEVKQQGFNEGGDEDVNTMQRFDRMQTVAGVKGGIQWEGVFFRNFFISLQLAWETNLWFGFNKIFNFVSTDIEGALVETESDLRASGLTARASISF